jgi:hypothetical protein
VYAPPQDTATTAKADEVMETRKEIASNNLLNFLIIPPFKS